MVGVVQKGELMLEGEAATLESMLEGEEATLESLIEDLSNRYGVQVQKLEYLLNNGVSPNDLEKLIRLKLHTVTMHSGASIVPEDFKVVEATYDEMLELYNVCRREEGDNWDNLAERIVEYALSNYPGGGTNNINNRGHWAALRWAIKLFKRKRYRMFADDPDDDYF